MKKPLRILILGFEISFLLIALAGCTFTKFDVTNLEYYLPKGYSVRSYEVRLRPSEFIGSRANPIKTVAVTYVSTASTAPSTVDLSVAEFSNSFDMHDFWHSWSKKEAGLWKALGSEWWWFSGKLRYSDTLAWYSGNTIFVLSSSDTSALDSIRESVIKFTQIFRSVQKS